MQKIQKKSPKNKKKKEKKKFKNCQKKWTKNPKIWKKYKSITLKKRNEEKNMGGKNAILLILPIEKISL